MAGSASFKAAVLVNSISALDPAFNAAFRESICSASPGAQVDFFDPIEVQTYPELGQYDLIVLTGGATADASAKHIPWVLKMHNFLRTTVEKCPTQKIVGVCWGHEVVHIAFGGVVGAMEKFEIGVSSINLTSTGYSFFNSYLPSDKQYRIHEFHELEVKTPGKGFVTLAENNQCLVNEANTILSFQGHPEMSADLSKRLLNSTPRNVDDNTMVRINSQHDGPAIWRRIIHWAGEM